MKSIKEWTRRPRLLEGVRLLDLGDGISNLCSKFLSELGAEIISPPLPHEKNNLLQLISRTDIVLGSGQPGVLERIGLKTEELRTSNPRLILASVTPFGRTGPRRDWLSCDLVNAAAGGQLYVTGEEGREPILLPGGQTLSIGALYAAVGIVLALHQRDASGGNGTLVEVSQMESVAASLDHTLVRYFSTGDVPSRSGSCQWNHESTVVPCRDGHIVIYPFQQWDTVVGWMDTEGMAGDLTDPEYRNYEHRRTRFDHVRDTISLWSSRHSRAELFETAQLMRMPWAPVYTPAEVLASPQLVAREFSLTTVGAGDIEPEPPYLFSIPNEICQPKDFSQKRREAGLNLPLEGIRVLDLTRVLAGPFATRILADFGADVIKVQTLKSASGADADDQPYFAMWNRNKRSVTIDMDHPESREVLLELVRCCDVVIENFSPRVLDNWDLGYTVLRKANPGVILLRMSAAGQNGPWRNIVAYGPTIHALSGLTALTAYSGGPPLGPGFAYSDVVAGLYGALAVTASLYACTHNGRGCSIDFSQYEAVVGLLTPALRDFQDDICRSMHGCTSESSRAAPYGCFRCQGEDRWCAVAVFDDEQWVALCEVLGLIEELVSPRFATLEARIRCAAEMRTMLEASTIIFTAEELARQLQERGISAAPVADALNLARDPQLQEHGFFAQVAHPCLGETTTDRGAIRLGGYSIPLRPAPLLGQDNEKVLAELLGWSSCKIEELRTRGVIA